MGLWLKPWLHDTAVNMHTHTHTSIHTVHVHTHTHTHTHTQKVQKHNVEYIVRNVHMSL